MARQRTRVYVEESLPNPEGMPPDAVALDPDQARAAELEAENIAPEDIEDLFRVSDEMRTTGGVVLQFTRTLPVATAGYVGEMAPAEFTLERARREFGVGTYRVRCMGPKGYVPGGGKLVIAPVPERPLPPESGISDVLAIIKADKEKKSAEYMEWAKILGPIFAPVIASMLAPKNQISELLQGMAALEKLKPEVKEPETLSKQLDNLTGIMAKLKEMSGDDKPVVGSTWIDLIREAMGGLRPVLEGVLAARMTPSPSAFPGMPLTSLSPPSGPLEVAPPAAPDGSATVTTETTGANPMLLLIPWLRATLQSLIVQAQRDRDPALYAEVTVENLPPGTDPKVFREFIEREDWWKMLQQFDARVGPYVGWFTAFRREVLEILKEGEPEKPTLNITPEHLREADTKDDM